MSIKPQKNTLDIRLAESVVFLRAGDATGRHRNPVDEPPGMLRGLLTLNLVKPTRITKIEVELVCKTSTAFPEGVGARRIDVTEEHKTYIQSFVYFDANVATHDHRRTLSIGPGLTLDREHDALDHSEESSVHEPDSSSRLPPPPTFQEQEQEERRGREPTRDTNPFRGRAQRRLSVDQTFYQTNYVSHHDAQIPTPPYSPRYSPEGTPYQSLSRATSVSQRSPVGTVEGSTSVESPAQSLEEFRRALRAGLVTELSVNHRDHSESRHFASSPRLPSESRPNDAAASLRLALDRGSHSGPLSLDEESEFVLGNSTGYPYHHAEPLPLNGYAAATSQSTAQSTATSPCVGNEDTYRGRKNTKRFSLASVSTALLEAVTGRQRSVSNQGRDLTPPPPLASPSVRGRGRTVDGSMERRDSPVRGRSLESSRQDSARYRSTLGKVGEVLGLDVEENRAYGDGWKEFKTGVYTYPVSFAIPVTSSPTLTCEYGSVIWRLKAYAHRPGTFKQKLSAAQEVTVVACPGEDDTEDTESIIVERQWDNQMQYLLAISGRSFHIGGSIPVSLTFIPWTKMKIFRLSVIIEERVDYLTQFKRVARTDTITRIPLLCLQPAQKDLPLLPLTSDDVDAFKHSPLHEIFNPEDEEDISEVASNFMGPGPWVIQKQLQLPQDCGVLHFTNKNKRSNIVVSHMMKIIFRVQRGDDRDVDTHSGKRKLYDIVVQTPIHILSCLCNPEYTSLPPYSGASPANTQLGTCRCGRTGSSNYSHTSSTSGTLSNFLSGSTRSHVDRHPSCQSATSSSTTAAEPNYFHTSANGVVEPRHHDTAFDYSNQFERLIAGQETEMGEAPPAYDSITST